MAKLDFRLVSGGGTFDLTLDPESLQEVAALEALLRTYLGLGGMQVQMNVVAPATLIEAQAHPENYRDLLVRVTGYSDHFTALGKEVQDDILTRYAGAEVVEGEEAGAVPF